MAADKSDPIPQWMRAAEDIGEYIGIRFGHLAPGAHEPDWVYLRHTDFDGIGAFAELLRRKGAILARLPQIKHPANPSLGLFIKSLPKMLKPRRRLEWGPLEGSTAPSTNSTPPQAFAWHLFDETTTTQIRRACRKNGFTVNSFLLKHLTRAIRPSLHEESTVVPWMILVNLRGKVVRERDTANFSSYLGVKVCSYETVGDIHRNIYAALKRGDHWANWYSFKTGHFLSAGIKRYLLATGLCVAEAYLGAFSNLGDWDPEKKLAQNDCDGSWLFCPPVLRSQMVSAGCVTFQNRLSLMIQIHPELTTASSVPRAWVQSWVKEIEMDLSSLLSEPVAIPAWMAA
jgi:NRPS condensation-like uncharacterized protein